MKYRLQDMSWMEAEDAFKRSRTVILPLGTMHGHGATNIGVDFTICQKLAEEVGKKTGILTLPVLPYGENDKQKYYPGSIVIDSALLESLYTNIYKELHRHGIRKVIVINGHGGNRDCMIRAAYRVRELGMLTAIIEWWAIGRKLWPDLFPENRGFKAELALSLAVDGKDVADLRGGNYAGGYKGEWGEDGERIQKKVMGGKFVPIRFNDWLYKDAPVTIPIDAWAQDVESPPNLDDKDVEELLGRGNELMQRLVKYISEFAEDFESADVSEAFPKSKA